MNTFKKSTLILWSLYYLYIPLAIFLCFWLKLWIGIPLTIALGIIPLCLCKSISGLEVPISTRQFIIIICILLGWVILSGIGGYVWQNRWDHSFRNAVFNDLFHYSWPIIEGESILTYYIGYWLPSAALAKITGNIHVGWICQIIYGFIGIYLAFRLTIEKIGKMKIIYVIPFIFFSGLDILGFLYPCLPIRADYHIELWSPLAFWESNTTLLFWVYNQAIPSWVGTMIVLNFGRLNGMSALTLC